jgi:hypothetical protein
LADLKLEAGAGFRNVVRMTPVFEILLQIIGSKILGTETKYRRRFFRQLDQL